MYMYMNIYIVRSYLCAIADLPVIQHINVDVTFTGNKKGDIHMRDRQVLVVNFVESTHTYLDAPCGFTIDSGAEIVLPTEVIVKGENFVLGGMITGVEYLYIDEGGSFTIIDDAQTGTSQELPFIVELICYSLI